MYFRCGGLWGKKEILMKQSPSRLATAVGVRGGATIHGRSPDDTVSMRIGDICILFLHRT